MTQKTTNQNPVCGARKRQGKGRCRRPAGWGTDHVGFGTCKLHGGTLPTHKVAAAREEAAMHVLVTGVPVDPATALLRCVELAAGQVEYASRQLQTNGDLESEDPDQNALSPWGRVQAEGMERLARFSKMALDGGVEERRIHLARRYGEELGDVISGVLGDLRLTPEQQALAPAILETHLLRVERGSPAT